MAFAYEELLKFRLLTGGVRVSREARTAWSERFGGPLTLAEYATTSGASLVLPGHLHVNAPIVADDDAPQLHSDGEDFVVVTADRDVPVDVVPVPAFHAQRRRDRIDGRLRPATDYGVTHTDRCRVSPIAGCAWRCHFCDLPYEHRYQRKHEDDLLDVIRAAKDDPLAPARHVLVSGGTPRAPVPDRPGRPGWDDEAWLDGVFAALADRSPLPVDVMMPPRRDLGHPAWLHAQGVNAVSINLEVSDELRARQIAPAKARLGRRHTLDCIERAVEAFGVGRVQSLVVLGAAIEPLESTLRGVQDLVDRGCVPVLSAFRPHRLTPLARAPSAAFDEVVTAYERTLEICERTGTGVRPGPRCVACHHNTVTVPDDSDFYLHADDDVAAGWTRC